MNDSYWCPSEGGPPVVTDDVVATAFRRIPLPPSTFSIQPPGGQTLVNFKTNFFTEERTLNRTVTLLGQRVDLRIWAHSYTWHFGDGEAITTSKPGAPYPKLLITHNYLKKGDYRPTMDTTWIADYRVGGGAWQSVPGSVTIEGAPADLEAIEARPTLVGYDG
ncbi:PKD domain-containing protein [Nocardioides sp. HM23]|uniref:PKD domain-containing protein n=1 Tax=Nocardioides bizhenqiangii TaxID=3095076 RepID=UPI002ACA672E|nr:PKD domain-containing protein [Nocardioides sp. HM23]MDZ5622060.1 PKD domain-containing protein [Nocardioides sp. HM23]